MKKEIKIKIHSKQYELSRTLMDKLFDLIDELSDIDDDFDRVFEESEDVDAENEPLEMMTEGYIETEHERTQIVYNETELTGMDDTMTTLSFANDCPSLITLLRGGSVTTAMVFEEGKTHVCVYETPIMPFELSIRTLKVKNEILTAGKLYLDYVIEFRGAQAERTKFSLEIKEIDPVAPLDEYDEV